MLRQIIEEEKSEHQPSSFYMPITAMGENTGYDPNKFDDDVFLAYAKIRQKYCNNPQVINDCFKILVKNLITTFNLDEPEISPSVEMLYGSYYTTLSNKHAEKILAALLPWFEINYDYETNKQLCRDMILHLCLSNPQEAGKLLNKQIKKPVKPIPELINLLIYFNADLYERWDNHHPTFFEALCQSIAAGTLKMLLDRNALLTLNLESSILYEGHRQNFIVVASMYQSVATLAELIQRCPSSKVIHAYESLKYMTENPGSYGYATTRQNNSGIRKYTQAEMMQARSNLLLADKRELFPLEKVDKDLLLGEIEVLLSRAKTIAEYNKIYDAYRNHYYLDYHRHPVFDDVKAFFTNRREYTRSKIEFITSLQTKIYNLLNSAEFKDKHPLGKYKEVCNELLDHPIFSTLHEDKGVSSHIRHQINKIVQTNILKLQIDTTPQYKP